MSKVKICSNEKLTAVLCNGIPLLHWNRKTQSISKCSDRGFQYTNRVFLAKHKMPTIANKQQIYTSTFW
ncbi:MAG: hypothetical protein WCD89_10880 [Anaerocolumna sp.]